MITYAIADKVEIIKLYFSNNQCANITFQLFSQRYGDQHVNRKYGLEIMAQCKIREAQRSVKHEAVEVTFLTLAMMEVT